MTQKIKHTKGIKSMVVVAFAAMAACGTVDTNTAGFTNGDGLLKGSAFDDSNNTSTGGSLGLRVRCEVRSDRSKVSVDANSIVAGTYKASVTSGGVEIMSDAAQTIGDEVEFDFDSQNDDIGEGATAINANFIQNLKVTGKIYTADGVFVAGIEDVVCEDDNANNGGGHGGDDDNNDDHGDDN